MNCPIPFSIQKTFLISKMLYKSLKFTSLATSHLSTCDLTGVKHQSNSPEYASCELVSLSRSFSTLHPGER